MQDYRKVVYLEPCIIQAVDTFRTTYADYYRGQIINTFTGLFCSVGGNIQQEFIQKAHDYVVKHRIYTDEKPNGFKRKLNVPIQMNISQKQFTLFDQNDDKIIIIAALLYANILN